MAITCLLSDGEVMKIGCRNEIKKMRHFRTVDISKINIHSYDTY